MNARANRKSFLSAFGQRPRELAWKFFEAIVQRLAWSGGLHLYGVFSRPLGTKIEPDPVVPGYCFRMYQAGEVDTFLADSIRLKPILNEAFAKEAFGKGDVCDAITFNGEIVSFSWSAFSATHDHDGVYVEFDPRHRYAYFGFTLPEFRGNHLPRLFRSSRDRHSISRGCTHSISYISIDNRPSIRSAIGAGSSRIGFAGYFKRGSLFWVFRTGPVRRSGFRFVLSK